MIAAVPSQDMTTIISTLGFPIFCVLALGWFIYKAFDKINTQNQEREKQLYGMLGDVRNQLNKATEINASFVQVLSDFRTDLTDIQEDVKEIKAKMEIADEDK